MALLPRAHVQHPRGLNQVCARIRFQGLGEDQAWRALVASHRTPLWKRRADSAWGWLTRSVALAADVPQRAAGLRAVPGDDRSARPPTRRAARGFRRRQRRRCWPVKPSAAVGVSDTLRARAQERPAPHLHPFKKEGKWVGSGARRGAFHRAQAVGASHARPVLGGWGIAGRERRAARRRGRRQRATRVNPAEAEQKSGEALRGAL